MKFLVKFEAFHSITGEGITPLRKAVGQQLEHIESCGRLVTGGMFSDQRGGFFVLEADSALELLDLVGGGLLDNGTLECHPVYEFAELKEFFRKSAVAEA